MIGFPSSYNDSSHHQTKAGPYVWLGAGNLYVSPSMISWSLSLLQPARLLDPRQVKHLRSGFHCRGWHEYELFTVPSICTFIHTCLGPDYLSYPENFFFLTASPQTFSQRRGELGVIHQPHGMESLRRPGGGEFHLSYIPTYVHVTFPAPTL